jgi:hypothetical protein
MKELVGKTWRPAISEGGSDNDTHTTTTMRRRTEFYLFRNEEK